jgi:hypothetical protein
MSHIHFYPNGYKEYLDSDGHLHNDNGPAVIYFNGDKQWYCHGRFHRLDGPAIEYTDGYECWFYHGKRISCRSQKEFEQWLRLKVFM